MPVMFSKFNNSYSSYSQYICECAPIFKEIFLNNNAEIKNSFEEEKHRDVNKYLYGPLYSFTNNVGKMHRPLTFVATYLALTKGDVSSLDKIMPIACAIENFQNAALIHDDIADSSELRRGKPCLHTTEGEGIAINSGDFGLASTIGGVVKYFKRSKFSNEKKLEIINQLIYMEYMTIEGQAMDLGWARDERFDITEDDYLCMAIKKTAYYSFAIPCVLAAICADKNEDIQNKLNNFGKKIGLAFQIQDDVLNLVGNDKNKDFRSDIVEGKRTLIICRALNVLCDNEKNILIDILQSHTKDFDKLNNAVEILESCGAIDYSKKMSFDLCDEARSILRDTLEDSQWKDILLDMTNWAVNRRA